MPVAATLDMATNGVMARCDISSIRLAPKRNRCVDGLEPLCNGKHQKSDVLLIYGISAISVMRTARMHEDC